jgi:ankyrin repeat protein
LNSEAEERPFWLFAPSFAHLRAIELVKVEAPPFLQYQTMSGDKPIDGLKKELLDLCRSGSLSEDGLREIIIERYGAPKNPNITDYAFFHEACRNERVTEGILRMILEYFPDTARAIGRLGGTPLHQMCFNKNATLGMMQLLIDACPGSLHRANVRGKMPLHYLCSNEDLDEDAGLEILKFLIERCPQSVRHATDKNSLPLHFAAMYQSPEFCRILIEAYPESERMTNNNDALPIHWACTYNTNATVKYLYKLYPESISVPDNNGLYSIHCVIWGIECREDNPEAAVEVVWFLLDCNNDVASQKLQDKFPLYWVCKRATIIILQS